MTDAEIADAIRLLLFVEDTDAFTPTLRRYLWALREIQRLRQALAAITKETSE